MKKLFFALSLLLTGCQSERVAFHFQPVAPAASPALAQNTKQEATAVAPAPRAMPATAATTPLGGAPTTATAVAARQPTRPQAVASRPHEAGPRTTAELPALATLAPAAPRRPLVPRVLLRRLTRQHATAGPAHTTESGLGGIALFFLGVLLAVLAGLGALLSLIPGISFFGGVGLAAAGLLVLFILYSLVSGGGKKKKAPAK